MSEVKAIYKYEIASDVELPRGTKIVSVGKDYAGKYCFWAIVPIENETEVRHFRIGPTGFVANVPFDYIGTIFDNGFVWHVLEVHDEELNRVSSLER